MQKTVAILAIISITLASLLAVQVAQNGGFSSVGRLIQPQPSAKEVQAAEQAGNDYYSNNNSTTMLQQQVIATGGSESNNNNNNASAPLDAESMVLNHVFNKAGRSVVQITSKVNTVIPNIIINGNPLEQQSTRLGSGFLYDSAGRIITNNHVVDGAKTVDVTFVDGNIFSAKVVGTDAFSDIAVPASAGGA